MDSALYDDLKKKSTLADETIERLKAKIAQLKEANTSGLIENEDEQVKRLKNENQKLKQEVDRLKNQLIELDKKRGVHIEIKPPSATGNTQTASAQPPAAAAQAAKPAEKTESKKEKGSAKGSNTNAKAPVAAAAAAVPQTIDFSTLDVRIGKIIECKRHPEADKLYVEQIDLGEDKPRTVCSGLVSYIPLEEMQNRLVVLLCNLKPAKLKGIESQAMVLCASTPEKVELINPPANAQIGDRVICSGYEGEPVKEINTKNKIFDLVQPDLKTNEQLVATYKGVPLEVKSKGHLTAPTLKNVPIK